ncbi:hypothetical protein GCM10027289_22260 [Tsukamurella serpentis]
MMVTGRTSWKAAASVLMAGVIAGAAPFAAGAAPLPAPKTAIRDCSGTATVMPRTIVLDCVGTKRTLISVTWSEWNRDNAIGQGTLIGEPEPGNRLGGTGNARTVGIHVYSPVGTDTERRFSEVTFGSAHPAGNRFESSPLP